jgi:hypothetical protein
VWIGLIVGACESAPSVPDAFVALTPDAALDRTCVIENVLARNGASLVTSNCGDLPIDADDASVQGAHDCVLAAAAQQRSFLVLWDSQGVDSRIAHATWESTMNATGCSRLTHTTGILAAAAGRGTRTRTGPTASRSKS